MNKIIFAYIVFVMMNLLISTPTAIAQEEGTANIEMADKMRADGKIYVVVLVIVILFCGLVFYAIRTDRKVSRLEKEVKGMRHS